ncbi:hypothetical protein NEOLI_004616 [Neolecta irregularis DAH-3]|uniref:Ubiquitin 3 binding protein But2 C-terminal domain-containing protein n=1 Tax=Neolecta irregularis (strain DAH-3) TaxID=1198029 RepID=A0A1U7LS66_NEOID|nr:hypothetical protein NEOLI_004616 [Neolecta irregularis DAH-3]|eukprot:OLL25516.1 hypothetical protein NEOLI_004616 [Neolecta irregularis DAH-3]
MQFTTSALVSFLAISVFASPTSQDSEEIPTKVLTTPTVHCGEKCGESTVLPGLLVPIKENEPNTAFGTQYRGYAAQFNNANKISTIASFGLDASRPHCHLKFVVPDGESANYNFYGSKQIEIYDVAPFNYQSTTWNNRPARGVSRGVIQIKVTGESNILHFPCRFPYGEIEIAPYGGNDYAEWFELANPTLGLVMVQD